jgi:hypothetical protein
MHRARFIFGITAFFVTTGIVVIAAQGRSGAPKPSHPTATHPVASAKPALATQPKGVKAGSPAKTMKPATAKVQAPKASKPIKTTKPAPVKLAKADKPVRPVKAEKPAKVAGKTEKTTTVAAPKPTTTTTTTALTPVQQKLQKNTNLAAKLASRLPAGTDLTTASAGFKNLGQFVAAVNVSKNLGIPFADLKTKMVTDGKSLGQAIQVLKPASSATIEAQHAEYDARGMIADSEQQPAVTAVATTTSTKTKPKKLTQ